MPIEVFTENLLTLTEAAKFIPPIDGKRVNISTLWRWCRRGLNGVRLEYIRIGCRIVTSAEALNRFANALAEADRSPRSLSKRKKAKVRQRSQVEETDSIKKAEDRLRKDGI